MTRRRLFRIPIAVAALLLAAAQQAWAADSKEAAKTEKPAATTPRIAVLVDTALNKQGISVTVGHAAAMKTKFNKTGTAKKVAEPYRRMS